MSIGQASAGGPEIRPPTSHPEINALLRTLLEQVQAVLGPCLVGLYLEGSLANGDLDEDSDIDYVVVTEEEVAGDLFVALQQMHDRLARLDSPWAIQLEGSYLSRQALRRHDPALTLHPNIERGRGERLKMAAHDEGWNVHRAIVRERGIVLAGPPPQSLIDPISPDDLRRGMHTVLANWATRILDHPEVLRRRGYQSYAVLSLCRILYTLQHGAVVSKRAAAGWAQETLSSRWSPLIERAWEGRHHPESEAAPEEVGETLAFIRFALQQIGQNGL